MRDSVFVERQKIMRGFREVLMAPNSMQLTKLFEQIFIHLGTSKVPRLNVV